MPVGDSLEGVGGAEDEGLLPFGAGDLEADREAFGRKAAGDRDHRRAGCVKDARVADESAGSVVPRTHAPRAVAE